MVVVVDCRDGIVRPSLNLCMGCLVCVGVTFHFICQVNEKGDEENGDKKRNTQQKQLTEAQQKQQ